MAQTRSLAPSGTPQRTQKGLYDLQSNGPGISTALKTPFKWKVSSPNPRWPTPSQAYSLLCLLRLGDPQGLGGGRRDRVPSKQLGTRSSSTPPTPISDEQVPSSWGCSFLTGHELTQHNDWHEISTQ